MATPITRIYQHVDLVMVRATTDPEDLELPHLDLSNLAAIEHDGRAWLAKMWARADVREALQIASPALGVRIDDLLQAATSPATVAGLRRAIVSVASYLLRWQRRSTPFGLFAGVTTASIGRAAAKVGIGHRALVRVDAEWLTMLIDRIQRHPSLRPRLTVVTNSAGIARDGRWIVDGRCELGARTPGPLREVSVRHTRPVRAALAEAATPIGFDALAERLLSRFPTASPDQIHALLVGLVDQGGLITSLRPPTTATDPLAHLIGALRAAEAGRLPDLAPLLHQLEDIKDRLARHAEAEPCEAAALRAAVTAQMTRLAPGTGHVLAVDVRLDAQITIPEQVLHEAERAASLLVRVSTTPFGSTAWLDYHARFRASYGPGALVPVRELVSDSGLGYPSGYLGAPRARPAWRMLTERDAALLALIQQAIMTGAEEIELTDADIDALTVGEHDDVVLPQRVELGVTVHATSTAALDAGRFELRVTAAPRAHTSMAGRFAPLLNDADHTRLAASYNPDSNDAMAVQLSFPPRRPHNENVVRVPQLLPDRVSVAEHPETSVIAVEDLAVTADAAQMYLVQRSTGRRVIPRIPHALDTRVQTPPLARFIAEVADARTARFGPLDVGAARTLPYIPRIRYRRTVLAPARWLLDRADLPTEPGDAWDTALCAWRQQWKAPARIILCEPEQRLPIDLDQPLDRVLLRGRLERAGRIELQEDSAPGADGWIGRPAEMLIPMTTRIPQPRPLPITRPPGVIHRPGASPVLHAHLIGNPARFNEILTRHLPTFVADLDELMEHWWIRRHRDMIRLDADQHLVISIRLTGPNQYGPVAAHLAGFAASLQGRGLPASLTLASVQEHPGRYGNGPALTAAERVFAADTTTAITQMTMAETTTISAQALAAASMTQLSASFGADTASGYRTLLQCLPQGSGPVERTLRDQTIGLSDPSAGFHKLRALPGGEAVAAAWQARDKELSTYHRILADQREPASVLRSLLHEHHVRALGVDPDYEKVTGRLARTAALRRLALAGAL
jgi:thiopeptide-type bacteriocin biosynthesis protein